MASNRDPRPSYRRRNRAKPTSSATRSKRTKASTAPKPTSSATRNKRGSGAKSRPVVTQSAGRPRGASGPRTAPVQGPSQKVSGRLDSAKRTTPVPKTATPKASNVGSQIKQAAKVKAANPGRANRIARTNRRRSGSVKGTLAAGLVTAAAAGSLRNPISKAKAKANRKEGQKATLNGKPVVWNKKSGTWKPDPARNAGNYNTRDKDGTVRSRKKVGAKKVGKAKVGSIAQSFDKAYGAAKKAGQKTFMFKGKKYTTK